MKAYIIDAFTNEVFKGNPAGVCILDQPLTDRQMQAIAMEFNLSETAFVTPMNRATYGIRYFSPKKEIPLCGHATLASAMIIFSKSDLNEVTFHTRDGLHLFAKSEGDQVAMEFPVYEASPSHVHPRLLDALGIASVLYSGYNGENKMMLLEIGDTDSLKSLSPDFQLMVESTDDINGVVVTAKANNDSYDFHSRYFWPWSGSNEDPVTGATHTFLASYWGKKLNKKQMRSFQSSERTGSMTLELTDNGKLLIKGQAVTVFEGELNL